MSQEIRHTRSRAQTSVKRKASDTPIIEPILQKTKLTNDQPELSEPGSPISINLTKRFDKMTVQSAQKASVTSKSDFPSETASPGIAKRGRGRPLGSLNKAKAPLPEPDPDTPQRVSTRSRTGTKITNNWGTQQENSAKQTNDSDDDDAYVPNEVRKFFLSIM